MVSRWAIIPLKVQYNVNKEKNNNLKFAKLDTPYALAYGEILIPSISST